MMTNTLSLSLEVDASPWDLLKQCPDLKDVMILVSKGHRAMSVLISGDTGTGKELVARAIHQKSPEPESPFVVVNCGGLNRELVGTLFFGHEPGSFTGARGRHIGLCEEASGGTLFLDEVGELPLDIQPRFLRVLQGYPFRRVGGKEDIKPNFKLVTATNRDLPCLVKEGTFRDDLWNRLNLFPIEVPPLSQRRNDIIPLARYFTKRHSNGLKQLADETKNYLLDRSWQGNVRELDYAIQRAIILAPDSDMFIRPRHFDMNAHFHATSMEETEMPPPERPIGSFSELTSCLYGTPLEEALNMVEKSLVEHALMASRRNVKRSAKKLGVKEATLYRRMKFFGIPLRKDCDPS